TAYLRLTCLSNETATPQIDTLSLHDALPISTPWKPGPQVTTTNQRGGITLSGSRIRLRAGLRRIDLHPRRHSECGDFLFGHSLRSEEHTSELQSRENLVCRLLLEKKKIFMLS